MSSSFVSGFVSGFIETAVQNVLKIDTRFNALVNRAGFGFKKHQLDGVMFCVQNEKKIGASSFSPLSAPLSAPLRGGIVADEMGLGKTLLMIGTMFANFLPKTIIVVPPILIQQWAKEIYRCSGHNALIYHGANKKRVTFDELTSKKTCIVLTTYNTLLPLKSKALNKGASSDLLRVQWDRVIFDEAHHLRNFRTARFQWCKQISAPIRWLITGTPIQNRRADFYSLCFMLGFDKAFFKSKVYDPIAYIKENYILRRTKAQVGIDLPPVNRTNVVVPWKNVGEKMLSEEMHSLITKQSGVSCDKGGYAADMILSNIHDPRALLLIAMMRSKQSCILPLLMKKSIDSCILEDKTGVYLDAVSSSSKLDAVIKTILDRKDNGKGKIVFCHFIDEIDTIARRLREGGVEKVVLYDGRTKSNKKRVFDKADVIILQIQTGCEGLNLQEFFSEIYFVSPHWNPAIEDQAIARCHRIGQLLDVEVFKFEMSGFGLNTDTLLESATLDKYVNQVQTVKRDIAVSVI